MRKRRCSTALASASESTAVAPALLVKEDASSQFEAEEEGSAS